MKQELINMPKVRAYLSHVGDFATYYRTLNMNLLICIVDGEWYNANDDDTWEEPISPIPDGVEIEVVDKPN